MHHHPMLDRTTDDETCQSHALDWLRKIGCTCGPAIRVCRCEECGGIEAIEVVHHRTCELTRQQRIMAARLGRN